MPNIAVVFKEEILRLARKEVKAEAEALRKTLTQQRKAMADLRSEVDQLNRSIKQLQIQGAASSVPLRNVRSDDAPAVDDSDDGMVRRRFSPSRLAAHRAKLGLSAAQYGRLAGFSAQKINAWEQGSSRPDASQLSSLVKLRSLRAV